LGGHADTQTETGDLISLLPFLKSRLKNMNSDKVLVSVTGQVGLILNNEQLKTINVYSFIHSCVHSWALENIEKIEI
jgi:hypothetical protein